MSARIYFEVTADVAVPNAPDFNRSTQKIAELYEKVLNLKVKGIEKLVLILFHDKEYLFNPPFEMFPFVLIDKKFDFDSYRAVSEEGKERIILETLYESVVDMCERMKIDLAPFSVAYEKVKEAFP